MHDDHGHDAHASHGHDDAHGHGGHDDHGHGGAVEPLEIAWTGLAIVLLAVALIGAVGWWASNNKPTTAATAAPVGEVMNASAQLPRG
jgi:hypothetical protein